MVEVFSGTSSGPCTWDIDVSCCTDWDTYSDELQTNAAEYGAYVMWAATGRKYGLCTKTVRPCGRECSSEFYNGYYWADSTWMPYILDGAWYNSSCNCGNNGLGCSCQPSCQVLLGGPVYAVSGVSVDGEAVSEDAWRVDNGRWLVRTDGDCWPVCQDYNVDSGVGTFFVTYQQGLPLPGVVAAAAGELACEWAKACTGQACRLPQRIQSVSRQGVSVSMVPIDVLLQHGLTGLDTVDQIIRSVNPFGLVSRMRIASPDIPVTRITTQA